MPEINLHDLSQASEPVPLVVNRYIKLSPEAYQQARLQYDASNLIPGGDGRNRPFDSEAERLLAVSAWKHRLGDMYLANMSEGNIQDPNSDVIGVYGFCDNRYYIWKDEFWRERVLTNEDLVNIIEYYKSHLIEELCDLDNIINKVGPAMDSTPKDVQHYIDLFMQLNKRPQGSIVPQMTGIHATLPRILHTPNYVKPAVRDNGKIDSSIVTLLCRHHGFVATRDAQMH